MSNPQRKEKLKVTLEVTSVTRNGASIEVLEAILKRMMEVWGNKKQNNVKVFRMERVQL